MIMPTAGSRLLEFAQKSGQYRIGLLYLNAILVIEGKNQRNVFEIELSIILTDSGVREE